MPQKTNAARFLDQMGIRYELREYEVDPDDLAAETVAARIGLPPEQLFNACCTRRSARYLHGGHSSQYGIGVKELQKLAGYIRGGVTPLAAKKTYPVHVDETIESFAVISVSAGLRGTHILLAPAGQGGTDHLASQLDWTAGAAH